MRVGSHLGSWTYNLIWVESPYGRQSGPRRNTQTSQQVFDLAVDDLSDDENDDQAECGNLLDGQSELDLK